MPSVEPSISGDEDECRKQHAADHRTIANGRSAHHRLNLSPTPRSGSWEPGYGRTAKSGRDIDRELLIAAFLLPLMRSLLLRLLSNRLLLRFIIFGRKRVDRVWLHRVHLLHQGQTGSGVGGSSVAGLPAHERHWPVGAERQTPPTERGADARRARSGPPGRVFRCAMRLADT